MPKVARLPANDRAPLPERAQAPRVPRSRARYFAFLSYSHKDEELAKWLHRELERFRVPASLAGRLTANGVIPKRLRPIFRDEQELAAADDLGEEIQAALASSQFLVVLCSPDAARSKWTNAEIALFKRTRPDGCVLAAIASGEPFASEIPGREQEECFPPALRQKFDRRGRPTGKRAEPLAADLRDQGDERRTGVLKLVAGMLGVGLDDLVQRDATRRHRRLGFLAAASLAGMAVTSGLAITALQARDSARDQRREAEGLVAFMLGDLKDKLEPIGRLDALDGVGSRVLAYYSQQDASELGDAALLQRSRALSLTAQVAYLRGDLEGAARLYGEAMAGTAEAIRRSPDDPQRLFDHAQNVFWIGDLARNRGDIAKAENAFREYGRLAGRMIAIEPDNLKWRMEVQYARENLGTVLLAQRRFAEAAQQFGSALGPIESAAALDPQNTGYQLEVTNVLAWLADAERSLGRFDAAIRLRERQIASLNRLVAGRSNDVSIRDDLIPAHRALGLLWTSRGDLERGVEHLRMGLAEANALGAIEPNNTIWKDGAAHIRLDLAANLLALGRRDEAAQQVASGCGTAAALAGQAAAVARWQRLQTMCLVAKARLQLSLGDTAQAQANARRAVASAVAERSGDVVEDRYNVGRAHRVLGDTLAAAGDRTGARTAWLAGLARLPANVNERPWEMNERAQLLERVGRVADARPARARLEAMGYHG